MQTTQERAERIGVVDQSRAQLKQAELRVTGPRLAVLSTLAQHPHSGADMLYRLVRDDLPGTSVQAVYNVLSDLTRAGILRRIEPAGSVSLYELSTGDNHHHLICSNCRQITDVDCAPQAAPCLTPADSHGFVVDEAEVTFWGLCPECASTERASTDGTQSD